MRATVILNATIAFVIVAILSMTLHEAGHFLASVSIGYPAILHHNYVQHSEEPIQVRLISSAAGPLTSLLIAVVFHCLVQRRSFMGITALTMIYMSMLSYAGFFGYLAIAPFYAYGDTGFILRTLACPVWLIVVMALAGVAAAFFVIRSFGIHLVALMDEATATDLHTRKKALYDLIFFPLFLGMIVTTLLNLPAPTPLSLIAPLTSPLMILWPFRHYATVPGVYYTGNHLQKLSVAGIILLAVVVVINRLLVPGLQFGG